MTGRSAGRYFLMLSVWLTLLCAACTTRLKQPPQNPPNRVQNEPTGAQRNSTQTEDGQWTMPAKDYASTRFSGLDQINSNNVGSLKRAWRALVAGWLREAEARSLKRERWART